MIKAANLNKTYYQGKVKVEAIKNINISFSKGESVIITGPSGAGKSTLLHLLGGLDKPTTGSVLFDGTNFYNLSDRVRSDIRNKKIGFVFQFYHLLPEFTVLENVMLPGLIKNKKSDTKETKKRAKYLLDLVSLGHRLNHKPTELSGGESQRAAIARALINSPDVLFCDEPTGNLDSKMAGEIVECLWMLKDKENMSLVMVTHDEKMYDNFDKRFRIRDGMLEELKDGPQSLPKWQVCR